MITLVREYSSSRIQINTATLGNIYIRATYRRYANRMEMSACVHRYELSGVSVMCMRVSEVKGVCLALRSCCVNREVFLECFVRASSVFQGCRGHLPDEEGKEGRR